MDFIGGSPEDVRGIMTICGGVLSLSAVLVRIFNDRLQMAKTKAARRQMNENLMEIFSLLFSAASLAVLACSNRIGLATGLFAVGVLLSIAQFLMQPRAPTRASIAGLVATTASLVVLIGLYWVMQFGQVLERLLVAAK